MKRTIVVSLILSGFFLFGSGTWAALEIAAWPDSPLGTELTETSSITTLVKYLYDWGISLGGFAVFIVLVAAGFQYLSSAGNPTKMKEARDRIRDAVLGLILLLGSVLILNTINPQLTQLRVPQIPSPDQYLFSTTTINVEIPRNKPCERVKLYSATGYGGTPMLLGAGETFNSLKTISSVKFGEGSCLLQLFYKASFEENVDYPSISFSYDAPNVAVFGKTNFRSGRLLDTYSPPPPSLPENNF